MKSCVGSTRRFATKNGRPSPPRCVAAAATLLRKLQQPRNPLPTYFTARQVYRNGGALLNRPEEAEAACEVLVDHHWLMATYVPTTERGGRPTYLYHLNPLANP